MFDIESKKIDEITITTKKASVTINVAEDTIEGNLPVGAIHGPGEFEIGDISIRGISIHQAVKDGAKSKDGEEGTDKSAIRELVAGIDPTDTIYDVEVGGVHVGIVGASEQGLDDLGISDILCTSSVRAVREIEPKMVIAMGNIDGMVMDLKVSARTEKKLKIKNAESLPAALEVVALS